MLQQWVAPGVNRKTDEIKKKRYCNSGPKNATEMISWLHEFPPNIMNRVGIFQGITACRSGWLNQCVCNGERYTAESLWIYHTGITEIQPRVLIGLPPPRSM